MAIRAAWCWSFMARRESMLLVGYGALKKRVWSATGHAVAVACSRARARVDARSRRQGPGVAVGRGCPRGLAGARSVSHRDAAGVVDDGTGLRFDARSR